MLCKSEQPPFVSEYMPLSAPLNGHQTPSETAQSLMGKYIDVPILFLGTNNNLPTVFDAHCLRTYAPFHVQVTAIDRDNDFVDYVYLAQASDVVSIPGSSPLCWFDKTNLYNTPNHVKLIVNQILSLIHQ